MSPTRLRRSPWSRRRPCRPARRRRHAPAADGRWIGRDPMNGLGPHLPNPAPIDAYGNGGFRFAGMSHRGSLLCLPNGVWASPVASAGEIDETALALALNPATPEAAVDHFLIGTGRDFLSMPAPLREAFRSRRILL